MYKIHKVFKGFVKKLSEEKALTKEYNLYETIERLAPKVISKNRKTYKGVSANIDFYSGFVYSMVLYISLLMDIDKK